MRLQSERLRLSFEKMLQVLHKKKICRGGRERERDGEKESQENSLLADNGGRSFEEKARKQTPLRMGGLCGLEAN